MLQNYNYLKNKYLIGIFDLIIQVEPALLSQLVLDTYECWKVGQKYEVTAKVFIMNHLEGSVCW
jgi:hypothetical protein